MINSEKLLNDLNLRLARFGNPDIVRTGSLLPDSTASYDLNRVYREIAARLVFKTE